MLKHEICHCFAAILGSVDVVVDGGMVSNSAMTTGTEKAGWCPAFGGVQYRQSPDRATNES